MWDPGLSRNLSFPCRSSIERRLLCWETDNKNERDKELQAPHSNSLLGLEPALCKQESAYYEYRNKAKS